MDRDAETGAERRAGAGRRAFVVGSAVALAGAAGLAARETLERAWWRLSGSDVDRGSGEVDHPGAEWVPASTANFQPANRPRDYPIDRVVIHVPEATYDITLQVFQDPAHGAASHYVVRSADGHVAQLARELDVAYHAGNRDYNMRSIGIEHEGWVDEPAYLTDAMYQSSARLVAGICGRYGIPVDREHIIGHNEVPDVARICPGEYWDWERYIVMVREAVAAAATRPAGRGSPGTG